MLYSAGLARGAQGMEGSMISGRKLASGAVWTFLGQALPLLVALFAIPHIIQGYGVERFGILSLIWVAIGYFGLFDLGMGRALTQLVARMSGGPDQTNVGAAIWTGLVLMAGVGVFGGVLLGIATPTVVQSILTMPESLIGESEQSFYVIAAAVPVLTISLGLRGVLEAKLKFGVINAISIPLATLTLVLPLLLLQWSDSLVPAVVALIACRGIGAALFLFLCLKFIPEMHRDLRFSREAMIRLLRFGSWMTVSNIVSPIMVNLDRFFIGSVLSVAATAYYSAPYDLVTKLWIVPASISTVLFPAFAASSGREGSQSTSLHYQGIKFVAFFLTPLIFVTIVFAPELLQIWLGSDFAREGTLVLQILALGVMTNSIAHVTFALVQGLGRADITAKLHLLEAPVYVGLLWWGVASFGIEGAAIAWTIRVTADLLLLLFVATRLTSMPLAVLRTVALCLVVGVVVTFLVAGISAVGVKFMLSVVAIIGFVIAAWFVLLTTDERRFVRALAASPNR